MATGRVGIRQNVNLLLDSDAQAFITAVGLSSDTHKNAINELVKDFKSAGFWTKMKAIYPMVGGTAAKHKFNLKDPRDANDAFRLTFYGGGTHGPNGYQPNGTDAYANTWLIPNAQMTASTSHASYYSRTNYYTTSERYMIGVGYTRLSSYNYTIFAGLASPWVPQSTNNNSGSTNGFFLVNRSPDNVVFISKNGSVMNSLASGTAGFESGYIYLGAMNWGGAVANAAQGFTFNECAFSSFGSNFTTTELAVYYRIVEKYQVALGRNTNTAIPFYYNNSFNLFKNLYISESNTTDYNSVPNTSGLIMALDPGTSGSYPGTGVSLYDISTNSYTSTLTNGPVYDTINGGAISLDGSNDYIQTSLNYSLSTLTHFTVGIWVKMKPAASYYAVLVSNYQGVPVPFNITVNVNGTVNGFSRNAGSQTVSITSTTTISDSNWHYCVYKKDGLNYTLYIDGVSAGTATANLGSISVSNNIVLGILNYWFSEGFLKGYIGHFHVYNTALTDAEVLDNYNKTKTRFMI